MLQILQGDENRSTCSNSALIQKWANSISEARPDVPPLHWNQANMAASTHSNMDITASFSGILNEKHCPDHLQVLKTFTASLRDKDYRWVCSVLPHFRTEALVVCVSAKLSWRIAVLCVLSKIIPGGLTGPLQALLLLLSVFFFF